MMAICSNGRIRAIGKLPLRTEAKTSLNLKVRKNAGNGPLFVENDNVVDPR